MPMTIRADSTEYATATITADHDITGDVINIALPVKGGDAVTWTTATVTGVTAGTGTWTATYRILLGPAGGDIALDPGAYDWLVKVTDDPEQPVRKADTITVT
ncbi:MAG: hypothetical protein ACRDQG_16635 [Pseudonocardiaceae bacterium]